MEIDGERLVGGSENGNFVSWGVVFRALSRDKVRKSIFLKCIRVRVFAVVSVCVRVGVRIFSTKEKFFSLQMFYNFRTFVLKVGGVECIKTY